MLSHDATENVLCKPENLHVTTLGYHTRPKKNYIY